MLFVINAKTYPESTGENAIKLGLACDEVISMTKAKVVLALQQFDLIPVMLNTRKVIIASQHLDPFAPGRNTGYLVPANIRSLGVTWSLINHSEHKLPFKVLAETIKIMRKNRFTIIACANTPGEARKVSLLKPDYIAVEPPELIGGKVSVSKAKPEVITKSLSVIGDIPLLVGAGIKSADDVKTAKKLGASGVLIASGVIKARSPKKKLMSLISSIS